MRKRHGIMLTAIGLALLGSVLFSISFVNAGVLFRDYDKVKKMEWFKTYIEGVGIGLSLANAKMRALGVAPLYCQPGKLVLQSENYLDILERFIQEKKNKISPETPIEPFLLEGLIEIFPCNK